MEVFRFSDSGSSSESYFVLTHVTVEYPIYYHGYLVYKRKGRWKAMTALYDRDDFHNYARAIARNNRQINSVIEDSVLDATLELLRENRIIEEA